MGLVWNITRAADEAEALAAELAQAGIAAKSLPCIARESLPWPAVPEGALLFITSAAATPVPDSARGHQVATLAPKLSALLRGQGLAVVVEAKGGVVSLAEAVAAHWKAAGGSARRTLFYPTSDLAPSQPEHQQARRLLEPLAEVAVHACYRVVAPPQLARDVGALAPDAGLVFFSPSAVLNFFAALREQNRPAPRTVVAHGASTARAWAAARPEGWPEAFTLSREVPLAETLRRLS